jgi:hypothetical protein
MPRPVAAPPTPQLDDVTYGYVPKSMSSMRALAPSTMTFLPDDKAGSVGVSAGSAGGGGRGGHRRTLVQDWNGIDDKWLQPCGELLVLRQFTLDVVPVRASRQAAARKQRANAREIAKALVLADEAAAVEGCEVVEFGKIANTQAGTGGLGRVSERNVT